MKAALASLYRRSMLDRWFGLGFVLALGSLVTFPLPLAISDSGYLATAPSELLTIGLYVVMLVMLARGRFRPTGVYRWLLVALIAFVTWYGVVEVVRLVTGLEVKQSLLAIRSTVFPIAGFFMFGAELERPRRAMAGLVVLHSGVILAHLPEWYNMRMSDFLGNSIVFSGLMVILVPFSFLTLAHALASWGNRVLRAMACFNIVGTAVLPFWAGSRSMALVTVGILVIGVVLCIGRRKALTLAAAMLLVAGVINVTAWWTNPWDAAQGVYRLVPSPTSLGLKSASQPSKPASKPDPQRTTAIELENSDGARAELRLKAFESFKRNPVIGEGQIYWDFKNNYGVKQQTAHNFVLEGLNAYGLIGFGSYLSLFVVAIWPAIGVVLRCGRRWRLGLAAIGMAGGMMLFSLVQPTAMIITLVVPLYVALGALAAAITAPVSEAADSIDSSLVAPLENRAPPTDSGQSAHPATNAPEPSNGHQ